MAGKTNEPSGPTQTKAVHGVPMTAEQEAEHAHAAEDPGDQSKANRELEERTKAADRRADMTEEAERADRPQTAEREGR